MGEDERDGNRGHQHEHVRGGRLARSGTQPQPAADRLPGQAGSGSRELVWSSVRLVRCSRVQRTSARSSPSQHAARKEILDLRSALVSWLTGRWALLPALASREMFFSHGRLGLTCLWAGPLPVPPPHHKLFETHAPHTAHYMHITCTLR